MYYVHKIGCQAAIKNDVACVHPCVHSSTIHNSQDMETTQMSVNR